MASPTLETPAAIEFMTTESLTCLTWAPCCLPSETAIGWLRSLIILSERDAERQRAPPPLRFLP